MDQLLTVLLAIGILGGLAYAVYLVCLFVLALVDFPRWLSHRRSAPAPACDDSCPTC